MKGAALPDREVASKPAVAEGPEGPQRPQKAKERRAKNSKNQPTSFDIEAELRRSFGVDLTRIVGIKAMTAQVILSELGPDLSAFPSEGNFASWLELTPRRDITGGRVIQWKAHKSNNRVADALRMAAESLWHSDSYLGARYPRLVTKGQEYVDRGAAYYERQRAQRDLTHLQRKAAETVSNLCRLHKNLKFPMQLWGKTTQGSLRLTAIKTVPSKDSIDTRVAGERLWGRLTNLRPISGVPTGPGLSRSAASANARRQDRRRRRERLTFS